MADTPQLLSSVTGALPQFFRGSVVRTMNRRSVLLRVLMIKPGAGKNVAWDIERDGMIAETFSDGDDVSNFGSDATDGVSLNWGSVRSNFRLGDIAAAAAASSSQNELADLLGNNFRNAAAKLASLINGQLYSGTATPQMIGLDTALKDDNTYAGIDRTQIANASWRANVMDSAGAALTLQQVRQDITVTIYKACGEQPDIALCSPEIFLKLGQLFEESRRRTDPVREITTARGKVILDGSIGAIEFEGCVFFKDKDATASSIYYVNSDYVEIQYLPQPVRNKMALPEMDQAANDGYGDIPLGMRCKVLGTSGASNKLTCQTILQLVVKKPNACGRRYNIG